MSTPPVLLNYLKKMNQYKASDLYITLGARPIIRNEKGLTDCDEKPLNKDDLMEILNSVLTSHQRREFETNNELNTSLDMSEFGRFRVNVMKQRQVPALVIRRIETKIPTLKELNLPPILESLATLPRGLVLFCGMTGSGKSTTLASMIDIRNSNTDGHILTVEDPIEYYHEHKRCVVSQREVGIDTDSFSMAMKNALRQRPDVILVGEIRDREVMEQVLTASETGHLCLSTIHTNNAYQAIERIVNMFPDRWHDQVRLNLAMNLQAIVSQRLLPSKHGELVPAVEIMINHGLIRELIIKGEIEKAYDIMEQNNSMGMCTFDQSMIKLYEMGMITRDTAIANADKPSDMKIKINNVDLSQKKSENGEDAFRSLDTSLISLKD